jgi:large subunit ribosomal protein L17
MRHQKGGRKLGRTSSHRKAMLRNMLASFFEKEKIETTTAKAKELRPLAEKMITLGKRGDLHARRKVLRLIPNKKIVRKLFNEIASRFETRLGGYTRIIRTGYRSGDRAPMAVIELVEEKTVAKKKKARKQKKEPARTVSDGKKESTDTQLAEKEKKEKEIRETAPDSEKIDHPEKNSGGEELKSESSDFDDKSQELPQKTK